MADDDLMRLYSGRIPALAADIPHLGRLQAPQGSARRRSPLCASTVTGDVTLAGGRLAAFGHGLPRGGERLGKHLAAKHAAGADVAVHAAIDVVLERFELEDADQVVDDGHGSGNGGQMNLSGCPRAGSATDG